MSLLIHELIHIVLSLFTGFLIWRFFARRSKIINLRSVIFSSLLGGFFVDADHLFDYILAWGLRVRLDYFFKGYQFLKSDKIYLPLHSWELVLFLFISGFVLSLIYHRPSIIKLSVILIAFSLSLFLHLLVDMKVDYVTFRGYSLVYRMTHNFELKHFVTENHHQKHLKLKKQIAL